LSFAGLTSNNSQQPELAKRTDSRTIHAGIGNHLGMLAAIWNLDSLHRSVSVCCWAIKPPRLAASKTADSSFDHCRSKWQSSANEALNLRLTISDDHDGQNIKYTPLRSEILGSNHQLKVLNGERIVPLTQTNSGKALIWKLGLSI